MEQNLVVFAIIFVTFLLGGLWIINVSACWRSPRVNFHARGGKIIFGTFAENTVNFILGVVYSMIYLCRRILRTQFRWEMRNGGWKQALGTFVGGAIIVLLGYIVTVVCFCH